MPTITPQYISQQRITSRPSSSQARAPRINPSLLSGVPTQRSTLAPKIPNITLPKRSGPDTTTKLLQGAVELGNIYFEHSMKLADRRSSVEALEASNLLREQYRNLNSGIAGIKGKEGATVYRDYNEKYKSVQGDIASSLGGQARVKFLSNTTGYMNSELDKLSHTELRNVEQWEKDVKINAEQGVAEEIYMRKDNLGEVYSFIAGGRALHDTAAEKIQYQDRMWKHWASSINQPGNEISAAVQIRKAMEIPPEQGGMTLGVQNELSKQLDEIDNAARSTIAYTDLVRNNQGDLAAARLEAENPRTWKKYGLDMDDARSVTAMLETTMRRSLADQEREGKIKDRAIDDTFYSLINNGKMEDAMVFANSIDNEVKKAEYKEKIARGQDRTDPLVYAEVESLISGGRYDQAERVISSSRLKGLSNVQADKLLNRVDQKSIQGSLGINQYDNAVTYAKQVLPKYLLGDFQMTMRDFMGREGLREGDPRVYKEAKNILRFVAEDPEWFGPDLLDVKSDAEMHQELESLARFGGTKRERKLAERTTLFEHGIENPDIDIFSLDESGEIPVPDLPRRESDGLYFDNFNRSVGL